MEALRLILPCVAERPRFRAGAHRQLFRPWAADIPDIVSGKKNPPPFAEDFPLSEQLLAL